MKLTLSRIAEILGARIEPNPPDSSPVATGFSIDSRTIRRGELFFAIRGEKFDGHHFLRQAFERGAVAAVIGKENLQPGIGAKQASSPVPEYLISVEDTLLALQTVAAAARRIWAGPLIAVTGSTGKTTTKDAIAHVLSTRFRVHKSEGNLNNHFGLPLMLLKLEPEHHVAVVELGMSHPGEITALAQIARPEVGVVTNVGPVHLEFFNSVAEIARAKYELVESLPATGTAVLNADDEYVSQFGRDFPGRVVTYGFGPSATVRARNLQSRGPEGSVFEVVVSDRHAAATLSLVGKHNVWNSLAAVAVGLERGLSLDEAVSALASFSAGDKRGEVVRIGNISVINDCYNSNPKALAAMVEALVAMPAKRRIVVAGEMLELGPEGEEMHRESGRHVAGTGIDVLIGVRGLSEAMVEAAKEEGVAAEFVATPEEAGDWLARESREGDVVLLKGSRGVKLEKAIERWLDITQQQTNRRVRPTTEN